MSSMRSGPLSDFGQHRVSEFAKCKAERIDARNARWRREAALLVGMVNLAFGIGVLLGIVGIIWTLVTGGQVLEMVGMTVLNLVVALVANRVSKWIDNPDLPITS